MLKHQEGAGRHKGRLGALLVEMPDGTTFSVGTGFSDAERESPPPVGSVITYRYQELSDGGVPRFPSYVGIHEEKATSPATLKGAEVMSTVSASGVRRFEYVEGKPSKFWEVSIQGTKVTTRYGRIGSDGQSTTKSFPDDAAATKNVEKLIKEKTDKGYQEVK